MRFNIFVTQHRAFATQEGLAMGISCSKSILVLAIVFAMSTFEHATARKGGGAQSPGQTGIVNKSPQALRDFGKLQPANPRPFKKQDTWTAKKRQQTNPKPPKKPDISVAKETSKKPKKTTKGQACTSSNNNCNQSCRNQHKKNEVGYNICSNSCLTLLDRCLTKANPK